MQLMLLWGDTGPFLAVQTGERLSRVCGSCKAIWLNDTMIEGIGSTQCQHREIGVLPVWKAPDPVAVGATELPYDLQDPNQVISAVVNKFATALEATLPADELAKFVAILLDVQKQLEATHG